MQKEYQALRSLPQNILVRAYSNRSDLIRCLIIGPAGTPFVEAPFLFDVFLSPATFPAEPPKVFFHSWCGGTRISPNLYAEGKVCLSLLGTWPGQSVSESWSSARSSILQIFVSIGSLVIVEEPYYTEVSRFALLYRVDLLTLARSTIAWIRKERYFGSGIRLVQRAHLRPESRFCETSHKVSADGIRVGDQILLRRERITEASS